MKTFKIIVLLLLASAAIHAQTADEIIDKCINAMGGTEKLKSVQTMKTILKIKVQVFELPVTMIYKKDGSMRNESVMQGLTIVQAYNGKDKTGWTINPMMGDNKPHKMNDEQIQQITDNENQLDHPFLDFHNKGSIAELIGKEDLDGDEVFKVMLIKKNGNIVYYYIDAQSYIIWKQESILKFKDKEEETETWFSNYKSEEGFTNPYTIENYDEGKVTMQLSVEKIEYNPKVDDKIFLMPETKPEK